MNLKTLLTLFYLSVPVMGYAEMGSDAVKEVASLPSPTKSLDALLTDEVKQDLLHKPFFHDSVIVKLPIPETLVTTLLTTPKKGGLAPAVSLARAYLDSTADHYYCWRAQDGAEKVLIKSRFQVRAHIKKLTEKKTDDATMFVYYGFGTVKSLFSADGFGLGVVQYKTVGEDLLMRIDAYVELDNFFSPLAHLFSPLFENKIYTLLSDIKIHLQNDLLTICNSMVSPRAEERLQQAYQENEVGLVRYYFLSELMTSYLSTEKNEAAAEQNQSITTNKK